MPRSTGGDLCFAGPDRGFCPSINIVTGPQGSGKTTTAEAIQHLFWPNAARAARPWLSGTLALNDDITYDVELEATHCSYLRDGSNVPCPARTDVGVRDRYRLSLHELLTAEDADLAARIQLEINGGYDLNSAAQRLGFSRTPQKPHAKVRELRGLDAQITAMQTTHRGLSVNEARLSELKRQVRAAQTAGGAVRALDLVIACRQAEVALGEAKHEAAGYDPVTHKLQGNELEQLKDWQTTIDSAVAERERLTAKQTTMLAELAANPLNDRVFDTENAKKLQFLAADLERNEEQLGEAEQALAEAQGAESKARDGLGSHLSEQQLTQLTELQPSPQLADFARQAEQTRGRTAALAELKRLALPSCSDEAERTAQQLHRAADLLRAWMAGGPDDHWSSPKALAVPIGLCVAVGVLGVFGASGEPRAGWGSVACSVLLAAWLVWRWAASRPVKRLHCQQDYSALGFPEMTEWNDTAVAERLSEHLGALSQSDLRRRWSEFVELRSTELSQAQEALDEQRETLLERTGLSPAPDDDLQLVHLLSLIDAWRAARTAAGKAEAKRDHLATALRQLQSRVHDAFQPFTPEQPQAPTRDGSDSEHPGPTSAELKADALRLERQCTELQQLRAGLRDCRNELERLADSTANAENERQQLFRRLGMPADNVPGNTAAIAELLRVRAPAREAFDRRKKAEWAFEAASRNVAAVRDVAKEHADKPLDKLTELRRTEEQEAGRADELRDEVSRIETLVRQAKSKHDLEGKLAERADKCAQLSAEREQACLAAAGMCCLDAVRERSSVQASTVLQAARRRFSQITHERYELCVAQDQGRPRFSARDRIHDTTHDLDTLSSGNRIQLLVAARLASLENQEEGGPMLPLVLDELLGNSDDARAAAIIAAVTAAAREGRQVFYFTAQLDEVGKWKAHLDASDVEYRVIQLQPGTAQFPEDAIAIDAPAPLAVPKPRGLSHAEYGQRLEVPRVTPFMEPDALHLWYVIRDCDALYSLLCNGYRAWGQVRALTQRDGDAVFTTVSGSAAEDVLRKAQALAAVWRAVLTGRRVGLGLPVTRETLAASGAVSATFIDRVAALAKEKNRCAVDIVKALRSKAVRGFQSAKADDLEGYLRDNDCLDDREPLSDDQMRDRAFTAAHDAVRERVLTDADVRWVLRVERGMRSAG